MHIDGSFANEILVFFGILLENEAYENAERIHRRLIRLDVKAFSHK